MIMALAVFVLLSMFSVQGQDQWSKTFEVDTSPKLIVKTGDAHIHVSTNEGATIEAKVTTKGWKIGEDGIHISDRQNGNQVNLEIRFPRHWEMNFNHRRVDVEIRVPRRANLNLETGDGNI